MPILSRQLQPREDNDPGPTDRPTNGVATHRNGSSTRKVGVSRPSQVRLEIQREFSRTTSNGTQDEVYTDPETLPSTEVAYDAFLRTYPNFRETHGVDDLREREFFHLEESQHVCMDYYGFGLFSYYQQIVNKASSSFGLAYIAANLPTHALYGAADEGTIEYLIRRRVMEYLNINATEYSMVFTASRVTAFKLLAESYPFNQNPKLLTVYDFESEAVSAMAECAKRKGAKVMSACFKWPSLRIGTSQLRRLLQGKKKKNESARGLFVFPVQSRMTGAKYSYQWMSEAQRNKWHVLLDASSLGPKDMDSLGLSLFQPDFIVSSFYKVFGSDPTGFGCLFVKNTAISSLQSSLRARAVGMVKIVYICSSEGPESNESGDEVELYNPTWGLEHNEDALRSFSGPFFPGEVPEVKKKLTVKDSNRAPWKSWNRSRKMEKHDKKHPVHLVRSKGLVDTVGGIEGAAASRTEFLAQRFQSESTGAEFDGIQAYEVNENGHGQELPTRLYETSEDEIEELEDDQVIGEGNSRWPINFQWLSGIQQEYEPLEFLSLGRKGVSPIPEVDVEDQEVEEPWDDEGEGSGKAIDIVNGSGGNHMASFHGSRKRGTDEIDHDAVDLENSSVEDLGYFNAEAIQDGSMKSDSSGIQESPPDSGLKLKDLGSEEVSESNLTVRQHKDSVNGISEVRNVKESNNFELNGELSNHGEDSSSLSGTLSNPGLFSSVKGRVESFETRPSFEKHTGEQLTDFQQIGVQGLVQKFQCLSSSSLLGCERTPDVSEEKFLTNQLSRGLENGSEIVSKAVVVASPSGSQESSEVETCPAESEQRNHVPTTDDSSSPKTSFTEKHTEEGGRLVKSPSRSPSIQSDDGPPSISTRLCRVGTSEPHSKEERGTDDAIFDIVNFEDKRHQSFKDGRSDLRSNITLSRDVEFKYTMYTGRRQYSSFEPITLATALAEETARLDVDDSDDEFFHSERYGGSRDQSRFPVDDRQPASYWEGEEVDAEDEFEHITEPDLQDDRRDLVITCKGLDFADSLGLTKLNYRLRYLMNWLVTSLLKLRHPGRNQDNPLVRIYGPEVAYDRGGAISFNILDRKGSPIQPGVVQRLADRSNISLGVGRLCNIVDPEMSSDFMAEKEMALGEVEIDRNGAGHARNLEVGKSGGAGQPLTISVVTAAVGFVTSFEDVYKLWSFLAKFLDAEYVSKEVRRYQSLNRQIMLM